MVSHEETRKIRMNKIKRTILEANGEPINKEKLIAICCFEWGSTRKKILEYIKIIELSFDFKITWQKK